MSPADNLPARGGVVLDHIGLFVPDMAAAAAAMAALGFRLTPLTPQRHRLAAGEPLVPAGTANRLAIMGLGYVELLTPVADTPIATQLRTAMARYPGLHLIAFGTADAEAAHRHLAEEGFGPLPVIHLERTVERAGGPGVARFSVVRVPPGTMAEGRIQLCRHHTPELVWQAPWLDQPNRAEALSDVLISVADPAATVARYARFVSAESGPAPHPAITISDRVRTLRLARGRLSFCAPDVLPEILGVTPPASPFMAAFAVTVADLAAARAHLEANQVRHRPLGPDAMVAALGAGLAVDLVLLGRDATPPWI